MQASFWITIVYAKTNTRRRKNLWKSINNTSNHINGPWSIGGDFNVIMDANEKKGGRIYRLSKIMDFIKCMKDCGMADSSYTGNNYTWTNGRRRNNMILQRLDRIFYNDQWSAIFPVATVRHLPRTGSDHNVMLYQCTKSDPPPIKYFRFLNFWLDQPNFEQKNLRRRLKIWRINMNKMTATEEEGDSNSKYFYSAIRQKRKRSFLHRIKDEQGQWIQGNEKIAKAAISHFSNHFSQPDQNNDIGFLKRIDNTITWEDNQALLQLPSDEEVKTVVFELHPDSAAGPDGFNGRFFHACWHIIADDVRDMVKEFFDGPLGIKVGCHSIVYTIKEWRNVQNKNDIQRKLCQVFPIFICWELWKHRCSIRYGNINSTIAKLRHSILFHMKVYMKKIGATVDMKWKWHQIFSYMEDYRPRITSTPVIWNKPPEGVLKIITDGSSNITKRTAGIGGVVRNRNRDMIRAFA
ncbi:uncharacterized protein LOC107784422 [Nicotiana tabacum]|uniref:Uncharacterized protein LOC107784422 n=1 Tax=Nicotiana tabacum TaxID=4097 RepID=A0AC58SEY8_TOBAC